MGLLYRVIRGFLKGVCPRFLDSNNAGLENSRVVYKLCYNDVFRPVRVILDDYKFSIYYEINEGVIIS